MNVEIGNQAAQFHFQDLLCSAWLSKLRGGLVVRASDFCKAILIPQFLEHFDPEAGKISWIYNTSRIPQTWSSVATTWFSAKHEIFPLEGDHQTILYLGVSSPTLGIPYHLVFSTKTQQLYILWRFKKNFSTSFKNEDMKMLTFQISFRYSS